MGWKKLHCCCYYYYVLAVWLCVIHEFGYAWIVRPSPLSLSSVKVQVEVRKEMRVCQSGLWMIAGEKEEEEGKKSEDEWMEISKDMRVKELQQELKEMGISYSDCFDRESLVRKWIQFKQQQPEIQPESEDGTDPIMDNDSQKDKEEDLSSSKVEETNNNNNHATTTTTTGGDEMNEEEKEQILNELRSMRVKELRTACAEANIRWANMIEKEDLVQALWNHKKETSKFSVSGSLIPGDVVDINDQIFQQEISSPKNSIFVLDVYATWCGPCQLMAPHLKQAAQQWGTNVRVAKLDSDKYPISAGKLNVGGLPTIIIFDKSTGQELKRQEGALMKDGLLQLVQPYL